MQPPSPTDQAQLLPPPPPPGGLAARDIDGIHAVSPSIILMCVHSMSVTSIHLIPLFRPFLLLDTMYTWGYQWVWS